MTDTRRIRLRIRLARLGKTARDVADGLGIHQSVITRWERGARGVTVTTATLADALGVPAECLEPGGEWAPLIV